MSNNTKDNRFDFGENRARFLTVLNDDRIEWAERSLREMLLISNPSALSTSSIPGVYCITLGRCGWV